MKNITVKLSVDPQKYEAAQQFMKEKGLDIETELSKSVNKFYSKYVPAPVRMYIEKSASPTRSTSANSPAASTDDIPKPGVSEAISSENPHNSGSPGSSDVQIA